MSDTPSSTPNLDEFDNDVEKLLRLLQAREAGLFTWQMLVRDRMKQVRDLLNEYVEPAVTK